MKARNIMNPKKCNSIGVAWISETITAVRIPDGTDGATKSLAVPLMHVHARYFVIIKCCNIH